MGEYYIIIVLNNIHALKIYTNRKICAAMCMFIIALHHSESAYFVYCIPFNL